MVGLGVLALAMAEQLWRVWRGRRPVYALNAEAALAGADRHTAGM